jgi:hypothetical protein
VGRNEVRPRGETSPLFIFFFIIKKIVGGGFKNQVVGFPADYCASAVGRAVVGQGGCGDFFRRAFGDADFVTLCEYFAVDVDIRLAPLG